jgi:hypothetical protein
LCLLKNPATKKSARKTPRSKNHARVDRRLDSLTPKGTDEVGDFEKPTGAEETGEAKSKPSEITRGVLGKIRRAQVKAGIAEPTQDVLEAFRSEVINSRGTDHAAL